MKILSIMFLFYLIGCSTTYKQSGDLIFNSDMARGAEWYPIGDMFGSKNGSEAAYNDCVAELTKRYGTPKSIEEGQKEIERCMDNKGWDLMEQVWNT